MLYELFSQLILCMFHADTPYLFPKPLTAMDDERLKQGEAVFGRDDFSELPERVRSIRASERRIEQPITPDIPHISEKPPLIHSYERGHFYAV